MNIKGLLTLLALATAWFATDAVAQDATPVVATHAICGIDGTGSFRFQRQAREECARLVAEAQPGDVVLVRFLSAASYSPEAHIVRLVVPSAVSACANPYDRRCRTARAAAGRRTATLKLQAIDRIRRAQAPARARSDMEGFLAASADFLADAPPSARRLVVCGSDMQDNVGYRVEALDLGGAELRVVAFQPPANPGAAQRLRRTWEERFRRANVSRVSWRAAEGS